MSTTPTRELVHLRTLGLVGVTCLLSSAFLLQVANVAVTANDDSTGVEECAPEEHADDKPCPVKPHRKLLLEATQVVPPIENADTLGACGSFNATYKKDDEGTLVLMITGSVRNLTSDLFTPPMLVADIEDHPPSAIHIHPGRVGHGGRPIRNMTVTEAEGGYDFNGKFDLSKTAGLEEMLLSEQLYVLVHTKKNKPGELRGQILAAAIAPGPPTAQEREELQATLAAARNPSASDARFPVKLFEQYQKESRYPVLPLTHSLKPGGVTNDDPYPGGAGMKPEYRDRRDDMNWEDDRKKRYIRQFAPLNVDKENWVLDSNGNRTDRKSFVDHPGVQPRAARPLHYRFCVDDTPCVETPLATVNALEATEDAPTPQPSRSMPQRQIHPRDFYRTPPALTPAPKKENEPQRYRELKSSKDKSAQPEPAAPEPAVLGDESSETDDPEVVKKDGGLDPNKLFKTLPRFGTGGWKKAVFTYVDTPPAMFPEANPFNKPPGTNMLPTVFENMRDRMDNEMLNTLPSTPRHPYNLHDGEPIVSRLPTHASPTDDLRLILDQMFETLTGQPIRGLWEDLNRKTLEQLFADAKGHQEVIKRHRLQLLHQAEWAIDIIEGNDGPVRHGRNGDQKINIRSSRIPSSRAYRGFALLHHSGHRRTGRVVPIYDEHGTIVSGNIDVHQVWYDGRIESDTMFYDFGWDDIPLRVKDGSDIEVRWYSPTDPALTRELWDTFRDQRRSIADGVTPTPLDPAKVQQLSKNPPPMPRDVTWTVTFTVDILNRGEDDFSPTAVYFDYPERVELFPEPKAYKHLKYIQNIGGQDKPFFPEVAWGRMNFDGQNLPMRFGPPHVAMDGTFFPLAEGTRTLLKVKMAPTQYQNVHYTWGWRKHAPRAQAVENMHKRVPPRGDEFIAHYQVLKLDESFIKCRKPEEGPPQVPAPPPRFFRLRIDDHERMVFDGIDYVFDPEHPERSINSWVERYLDEEMLNQPRRIYTLQDGSEETESPEEHEQRVRISLRQQFNLLARAPFAHPPKSSLDDDDYNPLHGPIIKLGDLAPAKRMWRAFHEIEHSLATHNQANGSDAAQQFEDCLYAIIDARDAYLDWKDRNHLPSGLRPDPEADMTLLYVNNTMYGEMTDGGLRFEKWQTRDNELGEADDDGESGRPAQLRLTLWNGDYFVHGYANPDFGGLRGWENQFESTLPLGGQGSLFTFGRFHWRFNAVGGTIGVPPAVKQREERNDDGVVFDVNGLPVLADIVEEGSPPNQLSPKGEPFYDCESPAGVRFGVHKCWFRYNFEPSTRLRFYQFDPLHHDVAIYSVH